MQPLASAAPTMRPPESPMAVCPRCGAESSQPWENPVLLKLAALGLYAGPTQGGRRVCALCAPAVKAEADAMHHQGAPQTPGMPDRFKGAYFSNFEKRFGSGGALKAARQALAPHGVDLYLVGPTGTGKTRLAASILNEAREKGKASTMFLRAGRLIERLRQAVHSDEIMADVLVDLETAYSVRVLVLDDIGADAGTDFARRQILNLYEARLDVGLRTIWTSNLGLPELSEFFGDDRLVSRIVEAIGVTEGLVKFTGDDWRLRKRDGHTHSNERANSEEPGNGD